MSTYEISKSSLLSLKAEILRKQQELTKAKAENEVKIKNLKRNVPLELKTRNVEQKCESDNSEDEDLLKKSKEALEYKAKLYNKLVKTGKTFTEQDIENNRQYLVRFEKKSHVNDLSCDDSDNRYSSDDERNAPKEYSPKNHDEEWVEYVDCLGRTRTCLRKDLEYLKSKDKDLQDVVERRRQSERAKSRSRSRSRSRSSSRTLGLDNEALPEHNEKTEYPSSDPRTEMLRQQWEKEEEELKDKTNIHYQDILFNEARTHGVGYYAFSKDEDERAKQQEALKRLRQETKQQQQKAEELKVRREKQLAARVRAAKNRKRARLGMPPEEESSPIVEPIQEKEVENVVDKEKEKVLDENRKKHVRPWDIGKKGAKNHYDYTQEEWVEKNRRERLNEFAPPTSYSRSFRNETEDSIHDYDRSLQFSTRKDRFNESGKKTHKNYHFEQLKRAKQEANLSNLQHSRKTGAEVPPPTTYDYAKPTTSKGVKVSRSDNVGESIEAGLKFLRQQMEEKQSTKNRSVDDMFIFK